MSTSSDQPMAAMQKSAEGGLDTNLPPLPEHHPLCVGRPTAVLEVVVAAQTSAQRVCEARTVRAAYPMKLLLPRTLASFQPGDGSSTGHVSVPTPIWAFVISYGGGVVAGDKLPLAVTVGTDATVVLSSQGSTKVFHARGGAGGDASSGGDAAAGARAAVISTVASIAPGGLLAIVLDPLVCFARAVCVQATTVALAPGASCVLLDWTCSGRRARGESWDFTHLELRTKLLEWRPPQPGAQAWMLHPVLSEACVLRASAAAPLPQRMGPAHVIGTLVLYGPRVRDHARALLRDLQAFTAICFDRNRNSAAATAAAVAAEAAPGTAVIGAQAPARFFSASGAPLGASPDAPEGVLVRLVAEEMDDAYAWARAALGPLHRELGGGPFRMQ